jgi:hypothetical protein
LYYKYIEGESAYQDLLCLFSHDEHKRLVALRAYIFAPIFEELIFRSCIISVLIGSGWSNNGAMFCSPLFFGIAHIHHLYRKIVNDRMKVKIAILSTLFQFAYTSVSLNFFFQKQVLQNQGKNNMQRWG